jgi:hypothetical protein
MGNKYVTSKNDEELSLKVLNELIPKAIKSTNNPPSIKNCSKNTTCKIIKTPCELTKALNADIINFGKLISNKIITNTNEKNFNINLYTSTVTVNEDGIASNNNNTNPEPDLINENEYSNHMQIAYLNKIISSNRILKRIYNDYDSADSNFDPLVTAKYAKSSVDLDDLDLREYLACVTERLKNDPVHQGKVRSRNLSANFESSTFEAFSNFNIIKNKHVQKPRVSQRDKIISAKSSFNPKRTATKEKPIKLTQRNSANLFNVKNDYNSYKRNIQSHRGSQEKPIRIQSPVSYRSCKINTTSSKTIEDLKTSRMKRSNYLSNTTTISAKSKEPVARIFIDLKSLEKDDDSINVDTEFLKTENIEKLYVSPRNR